MPGICIFCKSLLKNGTNNTITTRRNFHSVRQTRRAVLSCFHPLPLPNIYIFFIKFRERSFVQFWNVMRFPIQSHHDAACFHPLVTTNDFSFLTLYKRNGEVEDGETPLKLKLVKGAREWSTKSSSTLNSNECNYDPAAAPCKAARLAIDPFENQIKFNWNAVLAEQLRSDLNLCKRLRKLCREDFLKSSADLLSSEPLKWILLLRDSLSLLFDFTSHWFTFASKENSESN